MSEEFLGDGHLSLICLSRFRQSLKFLGDSMDLSEQQLRSLSPVALAYVGDAVYELFVRGALLVPPRCIKTFHRQVVNRVRAEQQSLYLKQLMPLLTEAEQDLLRRGRNASPKGPKRLDGQTYQQSTSFEALIGYLYLTNLERLVELLSQLDLSTTEADCSD